MEFVDLYQDYQNNQEELDQKIASVIRNTAFIGSGNNKYVLEFEASFASFLGSKNCVGCANGTDALEVALVSIGVKPGDEVLVPAISWISTAEAVVNIGAKPVFVDVQYTDSNIDVNKIEKAISSKTKAIIPVHLYGNPANMPEICKIANKYGLKVLEDCAQAHGASINDKKIGTWGDAATFSFYPGKNLGTFGDAGAMIFKDKEAAIIARQTINHGQVEKHDHRRIGRNSRLDGIHAAILTVKLKYLEFANDKRIHNANYYERILGDSVIKPSIDKNYKSVFHLYVIKTRNREDLIKNFKLNQIPFGIHYPHPLPSMDIFSDNNTYEIADKLSKEILSLPLHPYLSTEEMDKVAKIINKNV